MSNRASDEDSGSGFAEEIAELLFRLRGSGRGPRGPRGLRGPRDQHEPHVHAPHNHAPHIQGFAGFMAIARAVDLLGKSKEPKTVSEIAEEIGVDQPRATRLVQQGVSRGLFSREADPDDARRTLVVLTDQGREFSSRLRSERRAPLDAALANFSAEEKKSLARLLKKLADNWPDRTR